MLSPCRMMPGGEKPFFIRAASRCSCAAWHDLMRVRVMSLSRPRYWRAICSAQHHMRHKTRSCQHFHRQRSMRIFDLDAPFICRQAPCVTLQIFLFHSCVCTTQWRTHQKSEHGGITKRDSRGSSNGRKRTDVVIRYGQHCHFVECLWAIFLIIIGEL